MNLILNNLRLNRRQLAYLMPLRLRVCSQQQRPALLTTGWFAYHKAGHFVGWPQLSSMTSVTGLPALFPFPLLFGRWWLQMRWVTRRWLGRIARVLAYLFFQLADSLLQLGYDLLQLIDNRQQSVDQCLHTFRSGFPILGRYARWRLSFYHLLIMLLFYRFVYPLLGGLTFFTYLSERLHNDKKTSQVKSCLL